MGMRSVVATVALASLSMALTAGAEVRPQQINERTTLVVVDNDSWEPEGFERAQVVVAAFVDQPPVIDGVADDTAWRSARSVRVPLRFGRAAEATVKAVYTASELFLLVSWPDATKNDEHHPWVWDAGQRRWVEGSEVEDSLLVSFEGGCDWMPSLLSGYVYDFDAWVWLAARSNPLGQAIDADGSVQDHFVPGLGFARYDSRGSGSSWNVKFLDRRPDILTRPWQELKRSYKLAPAAADVWVRYQPDGRPTPAFVERLAPPAGGAALAPKFPQFRPIKLTGDAAEVAAKGRWADGRWTVEFRRALVTPAGTLSDSLFERATQFSIHVFDTTERLDEASESGRLLLQFEAR